MKILFFAALFVLGTNTAGAVDFNCEGCGYAQMQSKALALGRGEHRLYSYSGNLAYRFSVTCQGTAPTSIPTTPSRDERTQEESRDAGVAVDDDSAATSTGCPFGRPLQVFASQFNPAEQHAFDLMRSFVLAYPQGAAGQGADLSYDTSQNPGNSRYGENVYQILNDNGAFSHLTDDMRRDITGFGQYVRAIAAMVAASLNIAPNAVNIVVTFRDGSSIVIKYDRNTLQFDPVPRSARDARGEPIVQDNSQIYAGTYYFMPSQLNDYLSALARARVRVVDSSSPHPVAFKCVWDPENNRLTCTLVNM